MAFPVNKVCQFLHALTTVHWTTVKRILRHIKSCVNIGLRICRSSSTLVSGYLDADSAGGFAIFLGNNLISWNAKKQTIVSWSSTKAEYKALAKTTTEIMWVQTLLWELQVPSPSCAKVWVDNLGAKFMASNPVFHGRMKHVEVGYHFVREHVARNLLDVDYVPTNDQTVEGFTKALSVRELENFKCNLNIGKVRLRGAAKQGEYLLINHIESCNKGKGDMLGV
jgi:hypothetical protein